MLDSPYTYFMRHAITLAQNAHWQTAPNPCVGAVLVHKGAVVAEGWHKGSGKPHAEVEAIQQAKERSIPLEECTLVVTLEPCRHTGKTPPCTDAILRAGIKTVIIGAMDPNLEASGGAQILRDHGVLVETGIAEAECLDLIDDFVTWQTSDIPYTILKLASTMDGRIASRSGHSKWVTAPNTRGVVHEIRRYMQAIIIGGNTFYKDDPLLTCRLAEIDPNEIKQPVAIVVTSRLPEASANYRLLTERPTETIFWTTVASAASPKAESLRKKGIRVIGLPPAQRDSTMETSKMRSALDLLEGFRFLRKELHCNYVLCEGGGMLGITLLSKGIAKELHLHMAPKILGDNEATPLFDGLSPDTMNEALKLRITHSTPNACDILLTLKPATAGQCSDDCLEERVQ